MPGENKSVHMSSLNLEVTPLIRSKNLSIYFRSKNEFGIESSYFCYLDNGVTNSLS